MRPIARVAVMPLVLWMIGFPARAAAKIAAGENRLVIHADQGRDTIAPEIYGHFAEHLGRCVYDGFWVGPDSDIENIHGIRADVVRVLQQLHIPVLRWPGGCFADAYHWRDGIGPRDQRPRRINIHWGGVTETNHFGTHEFLELCELLGCEAYVAGNVGSGTVTELRDWVEYMTADGDSALATLRRENGREMPWRIRFLGVGNENWGCGGDMRPETYADLYLRYQTYIRNYGGNEVVKVACGPGGADTHWTEVVANRIRQRMDALSLHIYVRGTGTWSRKGSATDFDEREWFHLMKNTLAADGIITRNEAILDRVDPDRRIGLFVDEWGTWWDAEPGTEAYALYQQNTLRDALSAGVFLNVFNDHCARVRMANLAQTVNVLQALILTQGSRMILTPTYHVFDLYQGHQGALRLPVDLTCPPYAFGRDQVPSLSVSASRGTDGRILVTICHLNPRDEAPLDIELRGRTAARVRGQVLTGPAMNSHNRFDDASVVVPRSLERITLTAGRVHVVLPPRSVTALTIEG